MELTDEEKGMAKGEYGIATQKAIKFLITLGEAFGAKRLIKIQHARLSAVGYLISGEDTLAWVKGIANEGGHFVVETIMSPTSVDFDNWQKMGIPKDLVNNQKRMNALYLKMGAMPVHSCVPHTSCSVLANGEHFCWGGASGLIFMNSLIGAMGNREGAPTIVMAAITGRMPEYGLHLKENRYGEVLVDLKQWDFDNITYPELVAIGYRIGEVLQDKIPVIVDIKPAQLTHDKLRWLLAGMPSGGAVVMCHIVGVIPEANTLEEAFGGREPKGKMEVRKSDISDLFRRLTTAKTDKIDMVCFGCPFLGYEQLEEVASYLEGQKVHPNVKLWLGTDCGVKGVAERAGIVETIEKAGGIVGTHMCHGLGPFNYIKGLRTLATDDVRVAHYVSRISAGNIGISLGDTKRCINAAITGRWE